jgi:hypothetical protein
MALVVSRSRIVRFVLAEALTISGAASLAALGIAYWGLRVLKQLTTTLPTRRRTILDARVARGS